MDGYSGFSSWYDLGLVDVLCLGRWGFGQGFLPFEGIVGWLRNLCIYSRITLSVNISVRQNDVEHGVCFTGLFQLLYVRTRLCSPGCAVICDTTRP